MPMASTKMDKFGYSCALALQVLMVIVFFCPFSSQQNELCGVQTVVSYSAQHINGIVYNNVTRGGCLDNSNKTYKIFLDRGRTINRIALENDTILAGQLSYSYDNKLWFLYDGNIQTTAAGNVSLNPSLFARYLQLSLGSRRGLLSCASVALYVCNSEAVPRVSLTTQVDLVYVDAINITCVIKGQPHPQVSWNTQNGYIFNSQLVINEFTTKSGTQNSTLLLSKDALARNGFKCLQNSPPCATVVCSARYTGSNFSTSATVNIDVGPSPQSNFSSQIVRHRSAILAWNKPLKDAIMNYTSLRLVVTSLTGPPVIIYVPARNRVLEKRSFQIPNLQPCIFYVVELMSNNYLGESVGVKTNFTTPGGVIGVSINISLVNSSAVTTSWRTRTLNGKCSFLNVNTLVLSYKCLSGSSDLSTCKSLQNSYRNASDKNATINNLNPATTYTLQIIALTEREGVNVTSNMVRFTTNDALPSEAPLNLTAFALNVTAIMIEWERVPVSKSHGLIIQYAMTVLQPGLVNRSSTFGNTTLKAVVDDLSVCTEYTFLLQGCTSAGCGPRSAIQMRTADSVINASYTPNVTFDETRPNAIEVKLSIVKPESSKCIIGYQFQYRKQSEGTWSITRNIPLTSATDLFGFAPNTPYEFRSRLNGHSSLGNWSEIIKLKTSEGVPSEVRNLRVTSHSNNSVSIAWSLPSMPRGVIQGFVILLSGTRSYNRSFHHHKEYQVAGKVTTNTISNLLPATLYRISIRARNNLHVGEIIAISYVSDAFPPLRPEPPTVHLNTIIRSNVWFTFHSVADTNGPITKYQVIIFTRRKPNDVLPSNFTDNLFNFTSATANNLSYYVTMDLERFNSTATFEVGNGLTVAGKFNAPLNIDSNYTVYIRAVSVWKGKTFHSPLSSVDIDRYPINDKPVALPGGIDARSIKIRLPVLDQKVKYIRIIVQKVFTTTPHLLQLSRYEDANLTTYAVAKTKGFAIPYITAELGITYADINKQFVVGDGKLTNRLKLRIKRNIRQLATIDYFNGPLQPQSLYSASFRAYHSNVVHFSSDWSAPIMTSSLPKEAKAPQGSSAGLIAGITICVLAVPIFVLVGIILWRKHKDAAKLNYRFSTMELVANGVKVQNNHCYSDDVFETSSKFHFAHPTDFTHPPVPISDFPDYLDKLKEQDYSFRDEFEELDDGIRRETEAAEREVNKDRNREKSALPYDCFRVILQHHKHDVSDYINASFIDSYSRKNAYVATQAPLQKYLEDFWNMVWQNNVRTIVMLSHPFDNDELGNQCYWPKPGSSSMHLGSLVVKSEDTVVDDSFAVRGLTIRSANLPERRIHHFQFTKWLQHDAPVSADEIHRFRDQVNQWHEGKPGPMIVHCSKGCGRSGTYIALDAVLNNVRQTKTVDIFNFVKYLRTRRTNMVETERQYEFIHEAVLEVLTKVDQNLEIDKKNANSVIIGLGKIDPLTGYTGYTRLFKHLNHGIKSVSSFKNQEGSKAINDYKNRYSFKVPNDSYRVRLPIIGTTKSDMSDYINASVVAINDESRFITTQAPFGITVNDFWTMVFFSRAEVIVMLNDVEENSVQFSQYWPGADTMTATYGHFKVSLELESTPFPCIIRRDFTFSDIGHPEVHREITQFHVLAWDDHDAPSSMFAILQLTKYLANEHMAKEKAPIIVQCSDGFGRSGTFCACLHAVKQLLTEGKVHVPKVVRKFRERHTSYIENEAQFKFIFKLTRDLLEGSRSNSFNVI